ncbi:hypothetical protein ANN_22842 [Periplaneta americana]|uniref:Uncharacterized protein n=1 Tax=Periplaneta americana TaxID=6978 RepID=A0ABQ8SJG2_PERAM|nr:hypothetical protein ANN_22842 [Periplaneta americana]
MAGLYEGDNEPLGSLKATMSKCSRVVKKILEGKMGGSRKRGRPRLRWSDDVENDLRQLGVRRWRNKALDGDI